jgi:hypothetical protein
VQVPAKRIINCPRLLSAAERVLLVCLTASLLIHELPRRGLLGNLGVSFQISLHEFYL